MTAQADVRDQMLAAIPSLRAFAISLAGNLDRADDLVQTALLKALDNLGQFRPGTNMQAWLFTILRNQFMTQHRRSRREVEDPDGAMTANLAVIPDQGARLDLQDMLAALARLPVEQREALLLVGAEGLSYEEAARICGANLGTLKSRINRGRKHLAELLGIDGGEEYGPSRLVKAALLLHAA